MTGAIKKAPDNSSRIIKNAHVSFASFNILWQELKSDTIQFLLYTRITGHIRMRDEFCGLHPHKKVRDGCELDTIDIFRQFLCIPHEGTVQEKASRPIQRGIPENLVFLSGQVREDADGDGVFQIRMGGKCT